MSIRLRLTLLYSTLLAVTLVVAAILLYAAFARLTLQVMEDSLVDEAKQLLTSKGFSLDRAQAPQGRFGSPRTFVQTRDTAGRVIDRSDNLNEAPLPLSDAQRARALAGEALLYTAPTDGGRILIYAKAVGAGGAPVGVLQVARSIADRDASLAGLRRSLILGVATATLFGFGGGWLLAGIALRPVNRITRTARAIGDERDFGRRVDWDGPQDELGRLATTFNRMLAELQAAFSQEERALQAQRRFVADASHELRTPMTTIRGNIELLLRDPPISDDDRVAVITDSLAESDRLIRLINDLLLLERADADWTLAIDPTPLKPVVEEVGRQVQRAAPERRLTFDSIAEVTVAGNRDALKQVLLILLDNALKFTPPDGEIVITTAVDAGYARVSVRDGGPGIAPDLLPHIFERFYRGDPVRGSGGVGLGLAIARALMEAQRGAIDVASEPGAGATFTVSLPRVIQDERGTGGQRP